MSKEHAELRIVVKDDGHVDIYQSGCDTCLSIALASAFENSKRFREMLKQSFSANTGNGDGIFRDDLNSFFIKLNEN